MTLWMLVALEIVVLVAAIGAIMGVGAAATAVFEWVDNRFGSAFGRGRRRRPAGSAA